MSEAQKLYIQGAEITQAIQYYRSDLHLFDPQDRAPDNAAWLVAQKSAWVRVYVRSSGPETIQGVTGKLRVDRYNPDSFVAEYAPQPPGTVDAFPEPDATSQPIIAADAIYKLERSDITATLNFVIPSHQMCGYLRLLIHVSGGNGLSHEKAIFVNATHRQRLWLRAIMIGYDGSDPNDEVDPPTMTDLHATSYWTMLVYPISSVVYTKVSTIKLPHTLGNSGCDGDLGWKDLMVRLAKAADEDGNEPGSVYYGLIAQDIMGAGGCGEDHLDQNYGIAAGYSISPDAAKQSYAEMVMAHEIGHALERKHVLGCLKPDKPDINYPAYEPYHWPESPGASIGEYGLNISTGEVLPPTIYRDFMSYCPKSELWISLYGHKKFTLNPMLHPEKVCPPIVSTKIPLYHDPKYRIPDPTDQWITEEMKPIISIVGTHEGNEKFTINYVIRTRSFVRMQGNQTAFLAVLEDADGQELARGHMFHITSSAMLGRDCNCGCVEGVNYPPFLLKAILPDVAPGAVLRVIKDGEEIWSKTAPAEPPRILDVSATINREERLAIEWQVESQQSEEISCSLQWSSDDGESWRSLATDITKTKMEFNLEGLPAGQIRLRVIAHDGFFSVASDSVEVPVPSQPPVITILHPREGDLLTAGRTLRLWAAATSFDEVYEPHDLLWLINGREAGHGLEVWTVAPDEGEHECTLRLEGEHGRIQRTVVFKTRTPPYSHQLSRFI